MAVAVRERVLAALQTALGGIAPPNIAGPVTVYRNRRKPLDRGPAINQADGGHAEPAEETAAATSYAIDVTVDGYVEAASEEDLGPAISDLYAATMVAVMADRTLGGVAVDIVEGPMDVDIDRGQGKAPGGGFTVALSVLCWTRQGDPYAAAP